MPTASLEYLDLDLGALWQQVVADRDTVIMTHLYPRLTGFPDPQTMNSTSNFPWIWRQIRAGKIVNLSSLESYHLRPASTGSTANFLVSSQIFHFRFRLVAVAFGVLAVNTTRVERTLVDEIVIRLSTMAQIFANAIQRKRAEEEIHRHLETLKKQYEFEKLVSGLFSSVC